MVSCSYRHILKVEKAYLNVRNNTVVLVNTVIALLSPWDLFNFRYSREALEKRGLTSEGAYSQNEKNIYIYICESFSVLFYLIFCGFNIQFYESNAQIRRIFYPKPYQINMQACLAKKLDNL